MFGLIQDLSTVTLTPSTNLQRRDPNAVGQIWLVGLQQSDKSEQLVFAAGSLIRLFRQETELRREALVSRDQTHAPLQR